MSDSCDPMDCNPTRLLLENPGFSRQEHWSRLPFLSPRDLPNPGIEPMSPTLAGRLFITEPLGKPNRYHQFSSVQSLSRVGLFATPWTAARKASLSITNCRVHPNSRPSSRWCHPAISSSVVPFFSSSQSLPASESFQWVNSSHEVAKVLEFQL